MSAQRQNRFDPPGREPAQDEEWVRVPAVVDANGDKVVTLYDERGRPQTRLLAELILEAFVGGMGCQTWFLVLAASRARAGFRFSRRALW